MASSLILLDEFTASGQSEIIMGGASGGSSGLNVSMDSTYNVYVITTKSVKLSVDNIQLYYRYSIDGTLQSGAFYDKMFKRLDAGGAFSDISLRLNTFINTVGQQQGNDTGEELNGVFYFFNFSNSAEHSHNIQRTNNLAGGAILHASVGGNIYRQREAHNGVGFYPASGNIASGEFKLYGLKK